MAKESLASILSGEPLPTAPPVEDPEVYKFHRDLLNYLRRLTGKFTVDNLPDPGTDVDHTIGLVDEMNIWFDGSMLVSEFMTVTEFAEFSYSLDRVTHRSETNAGTDPVLSFERNGSALSGSGDTSLSTTQGVFTFDANTIAVGDRIRVKVVEVANGGFSFAGMTFKRTRK